MNRFIGMSVIVALSTAIVPTSGASAQSNVRTKYTKCLHTFANKHLDLKTTISAFRAAAENACTKEKSATWEETKKDELSYGSNQAEAKEFADEDISEMLRLLNEQYAAMQADNTKFVE